MVLVVSGCGGTGAEAEGAESNSATQTGTAESTTGGSTGTAGEGTETSTSADATGASCGSPALDALLSATALDSVDTCFVLLVSDEQRSLDLGKVVCGVDLPQPLTVEDPLEEQTDCCNDGAIKSWAMPGQEHQLLRIANSPGGGGGALISASLGSTLVEMEFIIQAPSLLLSPGAWSSISADENPCLSETLAVDANYVDFVVDTSLGPVLIEELGLQKLALETVAEWAALGDMDVSQLWLYVIDDAISGGPPSESPNRGMAVYKLEKN